MRIRVRLSLPGGLGSFCIREWEGGVGIGGVGVWLGVRIAGPRVP